MADLITRGIEVNETGAIVHEWERVDTVDDSTPVAIYDAWTAAHYAAWAAVVLSRGRTPMRLDPRADRPIIEEWIVVDGALIPAPGRTPRTAPLLHDR